MIANTYNIDLYDIWFKDIANSMINFLYNLILQPLIYIYEIVFQISHNILVKYNVNADNIYLFCILAVSIAVNIITLPLYNNANIIQENEQKKQKSMKKIVEHIKKTFSGDERFLILQAYYKEENYKPIFAIRSSLSLLLQIPFFTSAYIFFTELKDLNYAKISIFPFIENLMQPDKFISMVGGITVNILPIIMTIINLLAAYIYTKDFDLKDKLQPILLAIIFLFLLYNSPSALVIYWIFNNMFSLIKIIFLKTVIFKKSDVNNVSYTKNEPFVIFSILSIFITIGLLIPLYVLSSNPKDFVLYEQTVNDLFLYSINITLGFTIWVLLYYVILKNESKKLFGLIITSFSFYILFNHFCFLNNMGILTQFFVYDGGFKSFNLYHVFYDIIISILIFITVAMLCRKKKILFTSIVIINLVTTIFSTKYFIDMTYKNSIYIEKKKVINAENYDNKFKLSKTGKNVIVIMMDRSIGSYFPFVLSEKPELLKKFEGFVFYPNTLSSSKNLTITGAPALFGGYDYTTGSINRRKDVLLEQKHNEALSIMPYNFSNNNYDVFVSNLPFENYNDINKESIFSDYKNTKKINLVPKNIAYDNFNKEGSMKLQKRNLFFFSIMKIAPVGLKGLLYNNGNYLNTEITNYTETFLNSYYALHNLHNSTIIDEKTSNNFLLYCNETTHEEQLLPYKIYQPVLSPDNNDFLYPDIFDNNNNKFNGSITHLSDEICAYDELAHFFDFLKGNDLYDNTRIVIASDHGRELGTEMDTELTFRKKINGDNIEFCINSVNPTLLYKDFNKNGDLEIDNSLMVNADVPILATNGLFEAKNPYLNNEIDNKTKTPLFIINGTHGWEPENYRDKYQFTKLQAVFNGNNIFDKNAYDLDINKYNEDNQYGKE